MEKKKPVTKSTSKPKKNTKKVTNKKITTKRTTIRKKKKTKGFTLIELLAVIIILGVLMIIAIPSVTTYISNSRKSSYVDTVKNIIGAARNLVNSGKVQAYDRDTTYYIPVKCLPTENGARTPYGEFTEAYVAVIYDGNGYSYYWTGTDSSHTGVKKLVPADKLDVDNIETEVEDTDIKTNVGVEYRSHVEIIDKNNCNPKEAEVISAGYYVDTDGSEIEAESLAVSCDTNLTDGYCFLGTHKYYVYSYGFHSVNYSNLLTIPEGATEYTIDYSIYGPHDRPENYMENSNWQPVSIKNGSYTYTGSYWKFNGSSGYIPIERAPNNEQYVSGTNIQNKTLAIIREGYVPVSMYAEDDSLQVRNLCIEANKSYYFRVKFNSPYFQESDWYVFRLYVERTSSGPCIEANMEVEVYDEKKKKRLRKKIKDVTYNDLLLVWDFDKAEFTWAKPLWIKVIEKEDSYHLLKFSDGSTLKIVNDHRIFNVEKKMFTLAMTNDTPVGTTTLNSKGDLVKLISKETIEDKVEYCNIITERHINLFANDILTSWGINNIYPIEELKFVKDNRNLYKREDFEEVDDKWFEGLRIGESPDSKEVILEKVNYCKNRQK